MLMLQPIIERALKFIIILSCAIPIRAVAQQNDNTATITSLDGNVRILPRPTKDEHVQLPGIYSRLNRYYSGGKEAEVGMDVEIGSLIVTRKNSHVRIIYPNGDVLVLGPSTIFRLSWTTQKKSLMEIARGTIKAWINKEGPRSDLRVETSTSVMGVRGTVFVVSANSKVKTTKLTVMRGSVAFKDASNHLRGYEVAAGLTAIATPALDGNEGNVTITTTTVIELQIIQKITIIESIDTKPPKRAVSKDVARRVASLEQVAANEMAKDLGVAEPDTAKAKRLDDMVALSSKFHQDHAPKVAKPVKVREIAFVDPEPIKAQPAVPEDDSEDIADDIPAPPQPVIDPEIVAGVGFIPNGKRSYANFGLNVMNGERLGGHFGVGIFSKAPTATIKPRAEFQIGIVLRPVVSPNWETEIGLGFAAVVIDEPSQNSMVSPALYLQIGQRLRITEALGVGLGVSARLLTGTSGIPGIVSLEFGIRYKLGT